MAEIVQTLEEIDHDVISLLMARAWKNLTYDEKIRADHALFRAKKRIIKPTGLTEAQRLLVAPILRKERDRCNLKIAELKPTDIPGYRKHYRALEALIDLSA
jgi:hypothetical protein